MVVSLSRSVNDGHVNLKSQYHSKFGFEFKKDKKPICDPYIILLREVYWFHLILEGKIIKISRGLSL